MAIIFADPPSQGPVQGGALLPFRPNSTTAPPAAIATPSNQVPPASETTGTPSTTTSPSPTPTTTVSITSDQASQLNDLITNMNGYQPNPLNAFINVAYKIKLYMVGDQTITAVTRPGLQITDIFSTLDGAQKVIIAQSGVTAGYNITNLEIDANVAFNQASETELRLTVYESLSASFFDGLVSGANNLGIGNAALASYFLEISFTGYDGTTGAPLENILSNSGLTNGGRWIYQVAFVTIETNFDSGGATYKITAKIINDSYEGSDTSKPLGLTPEKNVITCQGATVSAMLSDLTTALNKNWNEIYPNDYIFTGFVTHASRLIGNGVDPGKFSVVPGKVNLNSIKLAQDATGKIPAMQIPPNTDITDVINALFSSTEEGQQTAKNVSSVNKLNQSSSSVTATGWREVTLYDVRPQVQWGAFDTKNNIYKKTIQYHIIPKEIASAILDQTQIKDAQDPNNIQQILSKLRSLGFFQKRYDYLHTGLNTEVRTFDVRYNLQWSAALPMLTGYRNTNESITTHASTDGTAQKYEQPASKIMPEAFKNTSSPSANITNNPTPNTGFSGQSPSQVISSSTSSPEQDPSLTTDATTNTAPTTNTVFTEDLSNTAFNIISITQKNIKTSNMTVAPTGRDRGLYGAIIDQIDPTLPYAQQMINVNMEIRGDPFWLGYTNMELKVQDEGDQPNLAPNAPAANYTECENYVLVTFSYPFGYNADGSPNFGTQKRSGFFNGIYQVRRVTNIFDGGVFTQKLDLLLNPLINIASLVGVGIQGQTAADPNSSPDLPLAADGLPTSSGAANATPTITSSPGGG